MKTNQSQDACDVAGRPMEHCDFCTREHDTSREFDLDDKEQWAHQLVITLRHAGVPVKLHEGEITPRGHKLIRKLNDFLRLLDDHAQDTLFGYEVRPVRIVRFASPSPSEQNQSAVEDHRSEPSE